MTDMEVVERPSLSVEHGDRFRFLETAPVVYKHYVGGYYFTCPGTHCYACLAVTIAQTIGDSDRWHGCRRWPVYSYSAYSVTRRQYCVLKIGRQLNSALVRVHQEKHKNNYSYVSHPGWEPFEIAIVTNPYDETPRRVYADWLRDHGEDEKAAVVERFPLDSPVFGRTVKITFEQRSAGQNITYRLYQATIDRDAKLFAPPDVVLAMPDFEPTVRRIAAPADHNKIVDWVDSVVHQNNSPPRSLT